MFLENIEVLLYGRYVAMIICHDVSFTLFYCIQNDQFYPQRTTKAVKDCEENLQWNVEFESRLWGGGDSWLQTFLKIWGTQRHVT